MGLMNRTRLMLATVSFAVAAALAAPTADATTEVGHYGDHLDQFRSALKSSGAAGSPPAFGTWIVFVDTMDPRRRAS